MNSKFFGNFFKKNFYNSKKFCNLTNNSLKTKTMINFSNKLTLTRMFYLNRFANLNFIDNISGLCLVSQGESKPDSNLEDKESPLSISNEYLNLILGKSLCVNNGKYLLNTDQLCWQGKS
jgi:hypothetical protein